MNGYRRVIIDDEITAADYATDDRIVDIAGIRDAVGDWHDGTIDTGLIIDVIDFWTTGEPIDES